MRALPLLLLLLHVTSVPTFGRDTQTITEFVTSSEKNAENTAQALKRCVGLYQAYDAVVRTGRVPKSDIWRSIEEYGPRFLYQAATLEPLPDFEDTLKAITVDTERIGAIYTDMFKLNLLAGKDAIDDFIAADLEFCHVYSLTMPMQSELEGDE
jgi:hypothetical protein